MFTILQSRLRAQTDIKVTPIQRMCCFAAFSLQQVLTLKLDANANQHEVANSYLIQNNKILWNVEQMLRSLEAFLFNWFTASYQPPLVTCLLVVHGMFRNGQVWVMAEIIIVNCKFNDHTQSSMPRFTVWSLQLTKQGQCPWHNAYGRIVIVPVSSETRREIIGYFFLKTFDFLG